MSMMPLHMFLYVAAVVLMLSGCVSHTSSLVRERPPSSTGIATVWNFDNPQNPFAASAGTAALKYRDPANTGWGPRLTRFAKASSFGLPLIDNVDPYVMEFPATNKEQGYTITHNSLPNGVFAWDGYVSNYNMIVFVYTVMDPDTMLRMISLGVDGMETDFPSVLNALMPPQ